MTQEPTYDWLSPLAETHVIVEDSSLPWDDDEEVSLPDPLATPDPSAALESMLPNDYLALALWIDSTQSPASASPAARLPCPTRPHGAQSA